MNKLAYLLLTVAAVYVALLIATDLTVNADGAGGSITYCTVKQPDGRLQLCTPVPGVYQAAGNNEQWHTYPTPTRRPKKTKMPTRTPMPTTTATATQPPCFYIPDPRQGPVPCPAIPSGK